MNPIAIWFHVKLGGIVGMDEHKAALIMAEQVEMMEKSGLLKSASEFHVNSHGDIGQFSMASMIAGPRAIVTMSPDNLNGLDGELPTFALLQDWIRGHEKWNVLYLHAKGVTKPDDMFRTVWRRCMMKSVVNRWRECVQALETGFDMAGAHWLSPAQYPGTPHLVRPIWGGNFFWSKVSYLLKLPPLIRESHPELGTDRYMAENWVGFGPNPKVLDLAPHWPSTHYCSRT